MTIWILVACTGGLLSISAFWNLVRKYHCGEIRGRYLLAIGVGYIALVSYALLSAIAPAIVNGVVTLGILLPAFVAIVVIVREHERPAKIAGQRSKPRTRE